MDSQKMTIDYAVWPRDAPSALEKNIITIICGNTRLHWALHEGFEHNFVPKLFWYTMHDDDNLEDEGDPSEILEAHVAKDAHAFLFGEQSPKNGDKTGSPKSSISQAASKRDAPGISVYVVSSNPAMEQKICHMFRDAPAKLYKLRNIDFFSYAQGVYPTMGVDRVAALYGARLHYGAPTLVIDGGTAMTYTMLDSQGIIRGGGISPGVKIRLQSLADYTGSLPIIDHTKFKTAVEGAIDSKTPLPFFAKDTETAMIAPVCAELSCQLRNIIKQYVSKCQSPPPPAKVVTVPSSPSSSTTSKATPSVIPSKQTPPKRYPVVITGGDGKFLKDLLQADASKIIDVEPDASPVQEHTIEIRHVKNLVTYALGDVIREKFLQKPQNSPEEKLRLKIQGLRIAAPAIDQKEAFSRGCVFQITPEEMIEGYVFHARFDNGTQKDLTLKELYDALVLYNEIGEMPEPNGSTALDVEEDWVREKKMWSRKVQEELCNLSRLVRNRMRQLKPHIEKGELAEIFKRWSSIESRMHLPKDAHPIDPANTTPRNKKFKRSAQISDGNTRALLGKRLAKRFPVDIGGIASDQIFFGTVKYISDNNLKWYFVCYDDGDSEDLWMEEVIEGIKLYEVHKFNDPMHKNNAENLSSASNGNSQQPQQRPLGSNGFAGNSNKEDETPKYTNLSTLLELSAASNGKNTVVGTERCIAEFKEDT